ncbi:MAG: DUF305 domain-containing protein [Candidatus Komeilibacteria bacterium]|nr:DUF305 domain-containing protein [Candidatus Komeilibacteria bacterium]
MQIKPYKKLTLMSVLSFIIMYVIMYFMVDTLDHVFLNINKFYMAGLMTLPMLVLGVLLMKSMYTNNLMNTWIIIGSAILFGLLFLFLRGQVAVADKQFLRSMIPHHSSAVLMCERAHIKDRKIQELCRSIVETQLAEIKQMNDMLDRLKVGEGI